MKQEKLRPNPFIEIGKEFSKNMDKAKSTKLSFQEYRAMTKPFTDLKNNYLIEYTGAEMASWWLDDDYMLSGQGLNSEDIADVIIALHHEGYDLIKLCQMNWSSCDNFHHLLDEFTDAFTMVRPKVKKTLLEEDKEWFKSLPEELTIYRGCAEGKEDGLSWTADKSVAEGFANGHRQIQVPDPRLCFITINKYEAYFAFNGREEQEIVWDASQAHFERRITIEPIEVENNR